MTSITSPPERKPWPRQVLALGILIAICYGAAYLGQLATSPNIPTWYAGLEKPWFNPPNAVFPIVWGILYTAMAVAAWLVWRAPEQPGRATGLIAFALQLVLNVSWSWAFFGANSPLLGLLVILPLLTAIAMTTRLFWRVDQRAGWLMIAYLVWVSFATLLNASILFLN